MEICSLEDDDYDGMFITQSSTNTQESVSNGNNSILGDPMDFSSPMVTLTPCGGNQSAQYSDISDDDMDPFPCSQNVRNLDNHPER